VTARDPSDGTGTWLLGLPPTRRQVWLAVAVAAILVGALAVLAPFTKIPLARFDSFIPAFEGTIFVTDLITAALLFSQFAVYRSRALLVLACGYLFSALTLVAHGLTFPGAFAPGGLLGAGLQSTAWIYWFWHFGFTLALLAYGLLKEEKPAGRLASVPVSSVIVGSVAAVCVLAGALTFLATAGDAYMPRLALDRVQIAPLNHVVGAIATLLCAIALAVLWARRRSVLDLWLMVVAVAALSELGLAVLLVSGRYTLGFYAGRIFSFLTATVVLVVLLVETVRLHARATRANLLLQREQNNRLMNLEAMTAAIAHEVRQPLTAVVASAGAAQNLLQRASPDLPQVQSVLGRVVDAGLRVSDVFDNIRDLFRQTDWKHEPVDLNDVIERVLVILVEDLQGLDIETRLALTSTLPPVSGHRGQVQEVVVNLVRNAVEAMATVKDARRVLQVRTEHRGDMVTLVVEDSGPGIDQSKANRIFDAFVTSKAGGMGLGLAICRMIVERHGGRISAAPAAPRGAVLRVDLPAADQGERGEPRREYADVAQAATP
jgi:signal transduction histidine kinase